jgi:hypothetical protein
MAEIIAAIVRACGDVLSALISVVGMKWVVTDDALLAPSYSVWDEFCYWWYNLRFYRADEIVHQALGTRLLASAL